MIRYQCQLALPEAANLPRVIVDSATAEQEDSPMSECLNAGNRRSRHLEEMH